MARFRGMVQGQRSEASRLGSGKSGLTVRANGWDVGCRVVLTADQETGKDLVTVVLTGGSNGFKSSKVIGTYSENDLGGK